MKKGTKKLIVRTITDRIADYERAIKYCKDREKVDEKHIEKLNEKVNRLHAAIAEIEGI